MSRVVPVLGIVGSVLAAMAALMFVDLALLLPAVFALGAGITLIVVGRHDWKLWSTGVAAIVFAILGIMGVLTNISTENGSLDLWIPVAVGHAFVVISCVEIGTASAKMAIGESEPNWLPYVWLGAAVIALIMALVGRADLSDQSKSISFIVAAFALIAMGGPILVLRQS